MGNTEIRLSNPPIVEAVLDIECDLPPDRQFVAFEDTARQIFHERYPKFRKQFIQEHQFQTEQDEEVKISMKRGVQALQFLQQDEKQLIQIRAQGFSFNRLSPYTSLDDYMLEIKNSWSSYIKLASPIQIRLIRLRYINRILLPIENGRPIQLNDYFKVAPHLPDEEKLHFVGFFNQHAAEEVGTGNQVNIVLTAQELQNNELPIIFDNCVASTEHGEPDDWPWITTKIQELRNLKNFIFQDTLTETCLNLFK